MVAREPEQPLLVAADTRKNYDVLFAALVRIDGVYFNEILWVLYFAKFAYQGIYLLFKCSNLTLVGRHDANESFQLVDDFSSVIFVLESLGHLALFTWRCTSKFLILAPLRKVEHHAAVVRVVVLD